MKILSNKKYKEMSEQINELKERYDDLWGSHKLYCECKEDKIAKLNDLNNQLKNEINELTVENKSLKSAKGGYVVQMNKLKKDLEETQKKLEESMSDKYLVKRVPRGKLPKGQVMKMKSHAKQDKIIQKVYEKMEKDKI